MEAVADASKLIPFRWRQNTIVERRRMRNDRKKRKRLQRKKFPQFPNAYISNAEWSIPLPCKEILLEVAENKRGILKNSGKGEYPITGF